MFHHGFCLVDSSRQNMVTIICLVIFVFPDLKFMGIASKSTRIYLILTKLQQKFNIMIYFVKAY